MTKHYEAYEEKPCRVTTVNIFKHQIKLIDKIIDAGFYNSRSAFIRRIIDMYLVDYYKMMKTWEVLTPEQLKIVGE